MTPAAPAAEPMEEEEEAYDEEREIRARRERREAALASHARAKAMAPPPVPPPPRRPEAASAEGVAAPVKDANKLAAQAMKAKLKGNKAGYDRLMKEAEEARKAAEVSGIRVCFWRACAVRESGG